MPFKFKLVCIYVEGMLNDTGTFNAGVVVMDLDILRWVCRKFTSKKEKKKKTGSTRGLKGRLVSRNSQTRNFLFFFLRVSKMVSKLLPFKRKFCFCVRRFPPDAAAGSIRVVHGRGEAGRVQIRQRRSGGGRVVSYAHRFMFIGTPPRAKAFPHSSSQGIPSLLE